MSSEESKKEQVELNPPLPPQRIGEHKSAEVDALKPTPERKAKTGEKS
jgi:hypothetical protein